MTNRQTIMRLATWAAIISFHWHFLLFLVYLWYLCRRGRNRTETRSSCRLIGSTSAFGHRQDRDDVTLVVHWHCLLNEWKKEWMKWNETKWNEMKRNEMKWIDQWEIMINVCHEIFHDAVSMTVMTVEMTSWWQLTGHWTLDLTDKT